MKIAIHSLPRSGTKNLIINFHRYLKSLDYPVVNYNCDRGLDEPFNFKDDARNPEMKTLSKMVSKTINGEIVYRSHETPVDIEFEMRRRLQILINLNLSWVFRRVPFYAFDPILYDTLVNVDKSIVILKDNVFEHCVSYTLASQLGIWDAGEQMNNAIEYYTKNQIELEIKRFEDRYIQFYRFNRMKWLSPALVLKFEEMVNIKDSTEFCEFFQIPDNDFTFSQFEIEFGNNKLEMISNIDELKSIATKLEEKLCHNVF